jgi:tRNA C32,U32 (ribose-2'-O)-methylase TrmJ
LAIDMEVTSWAAFACATSQAQAQGEVAPIIRTTMGIIMRPMNVFGISNLFAVSSIDSTTEQSRNSATGRSWNLVLLTIVCDKYRSNSNDQKATKASERKIKGR